MQWYEKDPCLHRSFSNGHKMKQSKNYLVCSEDVFQSSRLQNITDFLCTLYKMKKFRIYPLSCAHDRVFLNSPRRSPKAKKLLKDRGYVWIWSAPGRLFRVKIQPMQLPPHHHVHGFSHMIVIYLLLCWKMFQHALLKALFHNIAMTTLIEHARTFLYM